MLPTPAEELRRFIRVLYEPPGVTDSTALLRVSATLLKRSPLAHRAFGMALTLKRAKGQPTRDVEQSALEQTSLACLTLLEQVSEEDGLKLSQMVSQVVNPNSFPKGSWIAVDPAIGKPPGIFMGIDMGTGCSVAVGSDGRVRPLAGQGGSTSGGTSYCGGGGGGASGSGGMVGGGMAGSCLSTGYASGGIGGNAGNRSTGGTSWVATPADRNAKVAHPIVTVKQCRVQGCTNTDDLEGGGRFVDDLCAPCHRFLSTGQGQHSQAFRNSLVVKS